jgi:hypothetical protein
MVNGVCVCSFHKTSLKECLWCAWLMSDSRFFILFFLVVISCRIILWSAGSAVIFKSPESCYSNDLAGPARTFEFPAKKQQTMQQQGLFLIGHSCNLHQIFWIKKTKNQMTRLILMRKRPRISIGKSETRPEAMLARYTSESFQGNRLIKREEIVTTLRLRNIIQAAIAIARERIIKWQEGMCWDKLQTVG